jgi:hypothetical protein
MKALYALDSQVVYVLPNKNRTFNFKKMKLLPSGGHVDIAQYQCWAWGLLQSPIPIL